MSSGMFSGLGSASIGSGAVRTTASPALSFSLGSLAVCPLIVTAPASIRSFTRLRENDGRALASVASSRPPAVSGPIATSKSISSPEKSCMNDPQKTPEPQELSPEARTIIGRARKSFLFSIGLLIVGFIAIGGALVYRAAQPNAPPTGAGYVIASLQIPAGAEIISAVAADGQLTVTYKAGAMTSVRIFDGRTGEMVREIPVLSE